MTKRSDRKSSPRLAPLYDNLRQLERFRAHPAYAESVFIDGPPVYPLLVQAPNARLAEALQKVAREEAE